MEGLTNSEKLQMRILNAKAQIRKAVGSQWQPHYYALFPDDNTAHKGQIITDVWWCRKTDDEIVDKLEELAKKLNQKTPKPCQEK